jgi:hypothetical protein
LRFFVETITAVILCGTATTSLTGQDRTAELRSRFEHELNPIQKAKLMPDLGQAEFQQIHKDVEEQQLSEALNLLHEYDSQVNICVKGLASTNLDPERHPAGFKQLQISVRESLRRIDTMLPVMTADEQAPFLEIRKGLDEVNRHLIEQLFPGRTSPPSKPDKAVQ